MDQTRQDRLLPDKWARCFLQALQEELGLFTFNMLAHRAAPRFSSETSVPQEQTRSFQLMPGLLASEYSTLQQKIREYYGTGARGSLTRTGRGTWKYLANEKSIGRQFRFSAWVLLSVASRRKRYLDILANELRGQDGQISWSKMGKDLYLIDRSSDATHGQTAEEPICWVTLGMLQGSQAFTGGLDATIEEMSCRALGADACRFRISWENLR